MAFYPVIGSGFDEVNRQQMGWAALDNSIQEANLRRAQQAQETQNNWLAQVAQMRNQQNQQNLSLQLSADDQARAAAAQATEAGESRRRFDVGTALTREDLAEKTAESKRKYAYTQAQEKKNLDSIENAAKFLQPEIHTAGTSLESAQARYAQALQTANEIRAQLEKTLPPGHSYDPKLKEFKPAIAGEKPEVVEAIQKANERLAKVTADLDSAAMIMQTHHDTFNGLRTNASKQGLEIGKRGDKWVIFSPLHNKTYGLDTESTGQPATWLTGTRTGTQIPPGPLASPLTGTQAPGDQVRVLAPDGKTTGTYSRAALPEAIAKGFKVLPSEATAAAPPPGPALAPLPAPAAPMPLGPPSPGSVPQPASASPLGPPAPTQQQADQSIGFQPQSVGQWLGQSRMVQDVGPLARNIGQGAVQTASDVALFPTRVAATIARPVLATQKAVLNAAIDPLRPIPEFAKAMATRGEDYAAQKMAEAYTGTVQPAMNYIMPKAPPGYVNVRAPSPDGRTGIIPVARLKEALAAGYTVVE